MPAWRNNEYVSHRASASIAVAINAKVSRIRISNRYTIGSNLFVPQVPTLLHRLIVESYPYLDPVAYLLQPAGESEIDQILALRKGLVPVATSVETARPFWRAEAPPHETWERYHRKLEDWNLRIFADVYDRVATSKQGI